MLSTLRQRFWDKVSFPYDPTDEDCWEWNGAKQTKGAYGRITIKTRKCKLATHVAWFLQHGVWPSLNLLHKCDNPSCVNHQHLFEGTLNDNNQDMFKKNRHIKGSKTCTAKLNEEQVKEIKRLCLTNPKTSEIARQYKVSDACISEIRTGKKWKHVV